MFGVCCCCAGTQPPANCPAQQQQAGGKQQLRKIHMKLSNVAQGTHAGLLSGDSHGAMCCAVSNCNSPAQVQHSVVVEPCLELLLSLWLLGDAVHCAANQTNNVNDHPAVLVGLSMRY